VEILAPRAEYYRLRHSGRMLLCRESLSELVTGVAVNRCDDRHITWHLLSAAGLSVPAQVEAISEAQLALARQRAAAADSGVLLEQQVEGEELHVVVIGDRVAAATVLERSDGACAARRDG
jgi:hypothetical protein